ncbi:integrase, catalytic region, zinc finger, CCHC-type containing protein [Tanacetum coccineum]
MSPEWDRFVTAVKLNKGLKETNHEQLYAYLKQHEKHDAQDRLIIERITPPTNDPLAFEGQIVVQNVKGQQNQNQRYFARGNGAAGFGGHIARNCTQPKRLQNSDYFKDKMLLMQAQENGAVLDEEELLFLVGEQPNTFDADVDNQPVRDLARNEENIFQADYSSDASILFEVPDLENANVASNNDQVEHEIHSEVQHCASSAPNIAYVVIDNNVHTPNEPLVTELAIYKEQVAIYRQRAKFELTEWEQRIDDQMCILIQDRNRMEEKLKQELHSVKLQLNHSIKSQTDKLENKLHSQDQSIQTVHMMLKPKKMCEQYSEIAIGAQNPFYLRKAKMPQPTLYDGNEIINPDHDPMNVPSSEEDLELAELARQKMHEKINDPVCVEKRIKCITPNYSKDNFLATFTPQTQLTPEQVFWSIDLEKRMAEELKENTPPLPVLPPMIVYPPNTPVHLVPRTLPTTIQVNIGLYVITHLFGTLKRPCLKILVIEVRAMKAVFENMETEVDQNVVDKKYVFYTATGSVLNVSRFFDMHDAFTIAPKRITDLESENFNLRNKIQNDDHDSMIKHFSKLEVEHFNLQLKYQNLKERFGNKKLMTSSDAPSFDSLFVIGKLNEQIQNPIFDLKALVSQNKDLTAKLNALHDLNERFRAENAKAPGRNPIRVEPSPSTQRIIKEVHLHYIKHLKESVETLREIVEDAKVERPLDTSLASACRYTKHSQELLEYVIGMCPKDFSPRDKQNASTTSLRKKRVTFVEPCETSTHNTPAQLTGQKPRSNTKKDRTLPAKSALKQVEAHSKMNKSTEKQKNRVDSSISYKRTVINLNSNTSCKTCNKCSISVNHDQCVVLSEMFGKQSPATKVWWVKQVKQVWKATGKLFTTIGHQWRPTGRLLPLGDQSITLKSNCMSADPQLTIAPVVQIVLWYLDSGCSKHMTRDCSWLKNFVKRFIGTVRFGNGHFGAIMGYGDYVIGDSVISRVYYIEGLGHNLLSVGQFCDSDLEVAFRKHTCFVRDLDGVDLSKGSRGTNLYTISIEDMMRFSPICLLSKASKNKSWLWHRRLNHLNFGTLNDLARKDLVRVLPRLKFENDHFCSACQLGKSRKV